MATRTEIFRWSVHGVTRGAISLTKPGLQVMYRGGPQPPAANIASRKLPKYRLAARRAPRPKSVISLRQIPNVF